MLESDADTGLARECVGQGPIDAAAIGDNENSRKAPLREKTSQGSPKSCGAPRLAGAWNDDRRFHG